MVKPEENLFLSARLFRNTISNLTLNFSVFFKGLIKLVKRIRGYSGIQIITAKRSILVTLRKIFVLFTNIEYDVTLPNNAGSKYLSALSGRVMLVYILKVGEGGDQSTSGSVSYIGGCSYTGGIP